MTLFLKILIIISPTTIMFLIFIDFEKVATEKRFWLNTSDVSEYT